MIFDGDHRLCVLSCQRMIVTQKEKNHIRKGAQFNQHYLVPWQGQKFLGVSCGTNDASVKVVELTSSATSDGIREYQCNCKNATNSEAHCYIHYSECPV